MIKIHPEVKSRKIKKYSSPTRIMKKKQFEDKPPRYFIGKLILKDNRVIEFDNAMFFHLDMASVLIMSLAKNGLLDRVSHKKLTNIPIKKIHYSISIMDGDEYKTETFHHPFSNEVILFNSGGLCLMTSVSGVNLYKFQPCNQVLDAKSTYPVSQFTA